MIGRVALCMLFFLSSIAAHAQQLGENIRIDSPVNHDLYAAGRTVEIGERINGDAVVAGQTVMIGAPVSQDLMAAGEVVEVTARIGDDMRAAGRRVWLGSEVADHLVAAGETVTLTRSSRVGSFAWLAGREVSIDGEIKGPLKAAGETIRISGHVAGDATLTAEHIELLPGARIDGNLEWRGRQPRLADNARIGGRIHGQPIPERKEHTFAQAALFMALLLIATFALAGVALYLLFPYAADRAAREVRSRPALDALLGFVVLIVTPFAVLFLFVTGLGWLLGMLLLLVYLVALMSSGLIGAYALTDMALGAAKRQTAGHALRALTLVGTIIVVGMVQWVPFIGWLLTFLLVLWGLGATAQLLFRPVPEAPR